MYPNPLHPGPFLAPLIMTEAKNREKVMENEMNQITTLQREKKRGPSRTLQVIFTWLAFSFLELGSVIICLTWLGIGEPPSSSNEAAGIVVLAVGLATLFIVWLLSTIALALAKQWIAVVLALPAAQVLFYASWFFLAFTMNMANSGTILVLSLILINGVALLLAILFLKRTAFYKMKREKADAR